MMTVSCSSTALLHFLAGLSFAVEYPLTFMVSLALEVRYLWVV